MQNKILASTQIFLTEALKKLKIRKYERSEHFRYSNYTLDTIGMINKTFGIIFQIIQKT